MCDGNGECFRLADANAELLAALKAIDARYRMLLAAQPHYPHKADEDVLDAAFAAIQKAEGR